MQRITVSRLALLAGLFATVATAQDSMTFNRVDLSASAEREVGNDLVYAIVFAEVENNDQAEAAGEVNAAIAWAVGRARRVEDIEIETQQYTTRPVYAPNSRRISGWIARQSLRLESADAESLSELLGELQQRVAIQSMGSALSRAARVAAEEALIAEAIGAFERRAELVAAELGHASYRLVHLNVNTFGSGPVFRQEALAFGRDSADFAPPAIEAGEQTVSVTVGGTIELGETP